MKRAGFTLLELLVVILIIAILATLLFPAVRIAQEMARKTKARGECKALATALELYFDEYRRWPPQTLTTVPDPEANPVLVNGDLAKMLQGDATPASPALAANPKKQAFMTFQRFADAACTQPVNPWWTDGAPTTNNWYYYKVDKNFDNVISVGASPPPTVVLKRRVLVWTRNPNANTYITSAD